jgi:hypothetical protein
MRDLGAYTAVNLDGGGSTTLWFERYGTVNNASDGTERTVSNHMAVLADGSGAPEACDFWIDDLIDDASNLDSLATTDVDGDGTADLCARSSSGLACHPAGSFDNLTALSNSAGFDDPANYSTIRFGDVNGDGRADVCARSDDGFSCWPSTGTGFGTAWTITELADAHGWSNMKYYTTIRVADVTGDGRDDVCARAAAGIRCWPSNGAGFDGSTVGPELSDDHGWDEPYYYGTIRFGDIDGDGRMDLCARGAATVYCYRYDGSAWSAIDGPDWSNAAGWDDVMYWSTIRLADVDGDGRADLVGRDAAGVEFARSTGTGFAAPTLGVALADSSGWDDHSNYSTIRLGDLDTDGDLDLCARANAGYYCWLWDGSAWSSRIDGPTHSDTSGWADWRYYTTGRLADIDGDGDVELCDRAAAGEHCYTWDGTTWTTSDGPTWSDASGWDGEEYFTTIRVASRPRRAAPDTGDTDDRDTADTAGAADTAARDDTGREGGLPSHPDPQEAQAVSSRGGCGCDTTGSGSLSLVSLALAFARIRSRERSSRRRRG